MAFRVFMFAASLLLSAVGAANAAIINYSSNPFPAFQADVKIYGQSSSGSFSLTPGVAQTESVWLYDTFFNPQATFSNEPALVDLNLNGVDMQVPFLASATQGGQHYAFTPNGTVSFNIAGVGIVDVTGIGVTTNIFDPLHAGPTQASFYLRPADVPEPLTLSLFAAGLGGLFVSRRRAWK